jgi:hypothetical protein
MATVTKAPKDPVLPATAPAAAGPEAQPHEATLPLDGQRSHPGDYVLFSVWIICAVLLAGMLVYDAVLGLFFR